jgi:hypothetical protein
MNSREMAAPRRDRFGLYERSYLVMASPYEKAQCMLCGTRNYSLWRLFRETSGGCIEKIFQLISVFMISAVPRNWQCLEKTFTR